MSNSTSQLQRVFIKYGRWPSSSSTFDIFHYLLTDIWENGADPRVSQFPLMTGGPWPVLGIISAYLIFVKNVGPSFMKDRPAYDLRRLILCYNVFMMVINFYFFVSASIYTNLGLKTWGCTPVDPNMRDQEFMWKLLLIWFFLMSKFVDLLETVFFILRKKHQQVSFLHVFHHSIVPIDVWVGFKYSPSESACFFPLINSLVHSIMYLYYGLSTLGPSVRPYLWWKKYLTQIQIAQLIMVAIHCLHLMVLPNCNIPKAVFAIYLPQVVFLVYLFVSFFVNSYLLNGNGGAREVAGSESNSMKKQQESNGVVKANGDTSHILTAAKEEIVEPNGNIVKKDK